MAKLRPARTCRNVDSQSWARYSLRKPKKNYIRAMPRRALLIFNMGVNKEDYDIAYTLNAKQPIQLRSNALEAARQIVNKYLEKNIPGSYYFKVLVYPHNGIREHKMATGAKADRTSQGMAHSFGKAIGIAARLRANQPVFLVKTYSKNKDFAKEACRRAASKLSGLYQAKLIAS
ncbi:MAG: 50S ribosomal protein L16 [Candidatus Micrarchaeaceae archaeon]